MDEQDPDTYYAKLGQIAVELFQNPLSELTIKRQYNLLVTSAITTLLAFHILKLVDVSLDPYSKGVIPSERAALITFASLTSYLFIIYLFSIWQDYKIRRYKKLQLRIRFDQMQAPELAALKTSQEIAFALQKDLDKLSTEISEKRREREAIYDTYFGRINSLLFPDLPGGSGELPRPGEIEALQNEQTENLRPKDEAIDKMESKKTEMISQLKAAIDHSNVAKKVNDVGAVVESNAKLEKIRLAVEIVFPLAFSLFSITVSVISVIRNS